MIGQEEMSSDCTRWGLDWILPINSSLKEHWNSSLSNTRIDCLGKWLSHYLWRYLEDMKMCHLRTWSSGGLGSDGLTVGLNDLKDFKGLFQGKQFYDSSLMYDRISQPLWCRAPKHNKH